MSTFICGMSSGTRKMFAISSWRWLNCAIRESWPIRLLVLGMMAKQVMQPGIAEIGELVVTELRRAFSRESLAAPGAAAAALGLSRLGQAQQAISPSCSRVCEPMRRLQYGAP